MEGVHTKKLHLTLFRILRRNRGVQSRATEDKLHRFLHQKRQCVTVVDREKSFNKISLGVSCSYCVLLWMMTQLSGSRHQLNHQEHSLWSCQTQDNVKKPRVFFARVSKMLTRKTPYCVPFSVYKDLMVASFCQNENTVV